jgi:DNA-binding MarR family transcriptional regulator
MGATLAALQERGLIAKAPDPADGRRMILSVTDSGLEVLRHRRNRRTEQLERALSTSFTTTELEQLAAAAPVLERLANSI